MKNKPITPYERLIKAVRDYISQIDNPQRTTMWTYPKERLSDGWNLEPLSERVRAADQLGYDVRLRWTEEGLTVQYVKRPKEINFPIW